MEASLCSTLSSQEVTVNLYFVKSADCSPSNVLLCAYQACEEKFYTRWLSEEDYKEVTPTKEDVFICDPFEGKVFEYLVSCPKSIVVGPRCILSCLHRMEPIPSLPSPLHNTAMNGVVITCTGIPKAQKEEMQRLVQRMSGIYSNNYHQDVTHLVVGMVGSMKYKVAVEQGIPIMTEKWVTSVWEAVMSSDVSDHVSATNQEFLVPYFCQPLHGLVVCVSQADQSTKMALKKLIEENGGTYTTKLTMGETSVLIVSSPEGKKYQFAIKWGVPCVFPDWLHNSVQQGHALDKEEYEVLARKSSTCINSSSDLLPDLSMCSTILNDTETQRTILSVDETVNLPVAKGRISLEENHQDIEALENLDLQEAMRAGSFLKDYRLFLAGFSSIHMEKLRRVLGAVGASRLNQLTEAVTHIVLATPREEYLRVMQGWNVKPHVVSVRWITESVHLKHPAEESQFAFQMETNMEPQHSQTSSSELFSMCPTNMDNDETHVDERLIEKHFLQPERRKSNARKSDHDLSLLPESQPSELPGIFTGKTFTVFGHCQETKQELEEMIELHGGHVVSVSSSTPIHYSVMTTEVIYHPIKGQIVSRTFLEDCVESMRLLAVEYYHLPLLLPKISLPLKDCCITISTYTNYERSFLENLVTLLGAQRQEKFSKTSKAGKNILANTHLLCPTPIGAKYIAAKKWGIPAVTCDWLIECARSSQKVPEEPFLVEHSSNDSQQLSRKTIIMELWDFSVDIGEKREEVEEEEEDELPPTPAVRKLKSVASTEEVTSLVATSLSPERPFDREAFDRMYPTPGTTRYYQAKLEAEIDAMPTPDTPYGIFWYLDPPPRVRKCLKRVIDSLPDSSLTPASPPASSPTEKLFKEFYETLQQDLKKWEEKHQYLLDGVNEKIREKESKEDGYEKDQLTTNKDEEVEPVTTQITLGDPEEHLARLSIKEEMEKDTQDFSASIQKEMEAMNTAYDDSNKEHIPSAAQESKPPPALSKDKAREKISCVATSSGVQQQLVFLLVGMSDKEQQDYTEIVVQLGGTVNLSQTLEAQVTHLVAKVLSRSERTLMSIVSGRWVLTSVYLDQSHKAGHFLEEEPYAWGNPSSKYQPMLEAESLQAKLAAAAWRWKCAMTQKGDGQKQQKPFQNMTALIHTRKERLKAFTRLIEAGGGKVVSARPPYSQVEGITHFFVEMEKINEKIDLASFASRSIPCLQPVFINSCIIEDNPNISDFYIPAYKDILLNMSTCVPSPLTRAQRNYVTKSESC